VLSAVRQRRLRSLALAAMVIACSLQVLFSAVHLDLAYTVFVAWRFVHEGEIPWSGRLLAGTIHLGPFYYWLLALLLALTRSWLGIVVPLGLLAGLKIPVAYLLGKELHGRLAGFLFAIGLFVPNWSSFEWLFPGHNLLTTAFTLGFLLCAARYCRRPRRRYLIGMAAIFVLALDAHPSAAGLAWVGLGVLVWAWRNGALRWKDVLLAGAIGLIPLVPYIIWDASRGFADLDAAQKYLSGGESTGHLSMVAPILSAIAVGGSRYWFDAILGWPAWSAAAAAWSIAFCGLLGITGLAIGWVKDPPRRTAIAAGAATLLAVLVSTALIRSITPYYMTVVTSTALTGLVAIGLACLGHGRFARAAQALAIGVSSCAWLVCLSAAIGFQERGDWPFSFFQLFNVTSAAQPPQAFQMLPSHASGKLGAFLCSSPSPSAHGVLAQQLLHDYSIDMRIACNRTGVLLGGIDASREHWLGLSRAMFERLGVQPARYFGSIGIVAARPVEFGRAVTPQSLPTYPAYEPKLEPVTEQSMRIKLQPGERLAIANVAFGFVANPEVTVSSDGREIVAAAADSVARVYACDRCAGTLDVKIRSTDHDDIDVVVF